MDVEIKTMDLSFCGEVAHNVVNKEAKEFILKQLKTKYNIAINDNRAYILHEKSVYFLEKTQHIMSIKSSGTNYLLFFTRINNTNYCFYIDRKIAPGYTVPRIIATKYGFDDSVFQDTLLDGELVKNDSNQWMFLITDLLVSEGVKLQTNIISRFNTLYSILKTKYTVDKDFDICPLVVKKLFKYSEYDYLITQFIPSLSYKTKGIYFNTLNTKHANQLFIFPNENHRKSKSNRHSDGHTGGGVGDTSYDKSNRYQNKSSLNIGAHSNTECGTGSSEDGKSAKNDSLIFKLQTTTTPEIYNLYFKDNEDLIKYSKPAYIHGIKTSKLIRKLLNGTNSTYVYCRYNTKQNMWEPMSKAEVSGDEYVSSKQKLELIESNH